MAPVPPVISPDIVASRSPDSTWTPYPSTSPPKMSPDISVRSPYSENIAVDPSDLIEVVFTVTLVTEGFEICTPKPLSVTFPDLTCPVIVNTQLDIIDISPGEDGLSTGSKSPNTNCLSAFMTNLPPARTPDATPFDNLLTVIFVSTVTEYVFAYTSSDMVGTDPPFHTVESDQFPFFTANATAMSHFR